MRHPKHPVRQTLEFISIASCAIILSGCNSGTTTATAVAATTSSSASTAASAPAALPSNALPSSAPATGATAEGVRTPSAAGGSPTTGKCTDLTAAAAGAAVGKPTTLTLDSSDAISSTCDVNVAGEVDPIQLFVITSATAREFADEKKAAADLKTVGGVGDQAFTDALGVEVLRGSVEIKVGGPEDALKNDDYSVPTAIAKAMVAALK
ncbi:hypothetical protein ABIB25_003896 [Nakamurella sp. UYEF19]|uniref:hypothetical protein n=1 Tax=Nakamurella sp. UYEF19 TaxID=1756392 RepID=UPI00339A9FF4